MSNTSSSEREIIMGNNAVLLFSRRFIVSCIVSYTVWHVIFRQSHLFT